MILRDEPETCALYSEKKIAPAHLHRLAVVYVRQSTPQQVLNHRESTRLQYGLVARAQQMGWPPERVLVIDDDLGKSGADSRGRVGFRRLVSEVSLDHVGLILGVEMSRLARSSKDWHQLLEICALFGTLIADLDGVYDPAHFNDRLLLGLKGTMSEAELHVMKQRMDRGKLSKARRGELVLGVPIGYVQNSSGEVVLDPDEQVRHVVRLVFRKFEELQTLNAVLRYLVEHDVQIGVRVRDGIAKGELSWRRPNRATLHNMLKNPIYAGAYAYGRRRLDARKRQPGRRSTGRVALSPQEWPVLIKERFPAYIPWENYERNLARLQSNRSRSETMRAVRNGSALLSGVVVCGECGWRMSVWYGEEGRYTYACKQKASHYGGRVCQHVAGPVLDEYVSGWVLKALEPAALELSLEAASNLQRERDDLNQLWQERLERSTYEADRAERQYHLVEPENRLVARRLEREWEEKLEAHQSLEEDYERFLHAQPRTLSEEETRAIGQLSADIPALWKAPTTAPGDRKQIIRQVVERVVVNAYAQSERVRARIEWAGGGALTEGELIRPVARYEQLSYWPQLCERVRVLAGEGNTAGQIAEDLNARGYKPPKRSEVFRPQGVRELMRRLGLSRRQAVVRELSNELEQQEEWWLADLAKEAGISKNTLYNWVRRGWVRGRQDKQSRWIVWADDAEIERLAELHRRPTGYYTRQKWIRELNT